MSRIVGLVAVAGFLAVTFLAAVFVLQRRVLFPRPRSPVVWYRGEVEALVAGDARALLLPPVAPVIARFPVILFAHGNAELADDWIDQFEPPRRWGIGVVLLEYPGYGGAPGTPSEATIVAAARSVFDRLRDDTRVDPDRVVVYGRSLGGGVAARLAADRRVAAVILESAFTSVRPLATRFLVPGFLVRDPFDNLAALARYRGPLLVVHGERDPIIPVSEGRRLAAAVAGGRFVGLPCGHNDCPRPWAEIEAFLRQAGVIAD